MRVVLAAVVLLGLCTNAVQGSIWVAPADHPVLEITDINVSNSFTLDFSLQGVNFELHTLAAFADPANSPLLNFSGRNQADAVPGGFTFWDFNAVGWNDITPLVIPQPPYLSNGQQVSLAVGPLTQAGIGNPITFKMDFDSNVDDWIVPLLSGDPLGDDAVWDWGAAGTFFLAAYRTDDDLGVVNHAAWRVDVGISSIADGGQFLERIVPVAAGDFGEPPIVPEPASIAIWSVIGLVGLGVAYRRRRKAA